jgi:hypothetical protein
VDILGYNQHKELMLLDLFTYSVPLSRLRSCKFVADVPFTLLNPASFLSLSIFDTFPQGGVGRDSSVGIATH